MRREPLHLRAQRTLPQRLPATVAAEPHIALTSAFAERHTPFDRRGGETGQQLVACAIAAVRRRVRVAPLPRLAQRPITEHGEVHNVVFRFLSRFVFGHSATIDAYLGGLAKHCGGTGAAQAAEPAPQPPLRGG